MKKTLFPLFFTFILCAFISSCSAFNSHEDEYATVAFRMSASSAKELASRAALPEVLLNTKLSVTLFVNGKSKKQTADITKDGASIIFGEIEVGATVSADVQILKNDVVIAAGSSSKPIKVVQGENSLTVPLAYVANGNISLGERITIQLDTEKSSQTIHANDNEILWAFKLIDENGKDILADVDWETVNEEMPNSEPYNSGLLNISVSIRKGRIEIVGNENQYISCYRQNNTVRLLEPLAAGDYELSLTISPAYPVYLNLEGQILPFLQFEPTSASFEFTVEE